MCVWANGRRQSGHKGEAQLLVIQWQLQNEEGASIKKMNEEGIGMSYAVGWVCVWWIVVMRGACSERWVGKNTMAWDYLLKVRTKRLARVQRDAWGTNQRGGNKTECEKKRIRVHMPRNKKKRQLEE